MSNFLAIAVSKLFEYKTPSKVIDFINAEKAKSAIGNPPFKVKKNEHKR